MVQTSHVRVVCAGNNDISKKFAKRLETLLGSRMLLTALFEVVRSITYSRVNQTQTLYLSHWKENRIQMTWSFFVKGLQT